MLTGFVGSLNENNILPLFNDFIVKYYYCYLLLLIFDIDDYLRSILREYLSFSHTYLCK